jgi:membrane associated rhomboid family serine protease
MLRITDVVKHLIIINVIVYAVFVFIFPQFQVYSILHMPWGLEQKFAPVQLVTHMFMHDPRGFTHILFNMMSLYFIGPHIEQVLGKERFLIFYLACGFAAMGLHMLLSYLGIILPSPVVGASGAIMGIFIAFAILFPNTKLMLLFPPIPIKAKFLMGGLILFDVFSGIGGFSTGIAHFAHLGGALCGFVMMNVWGYFDAKRFR